MSTIANTLYVKMLTAREMDIARKREDMQNEDVKNQKAQQFALDVSRHIQDSTQKDFWRKQQLAGKEGQAAGQLGKASPASSYEDPSVSEYADVGHLQGQADAQALQDKTSRDAYARQQLALQQRNNILEQTLGLKERKLDDDKAWRQSLLPSIEKKADASMINAKKPRSTGREPTIPPGLKPLFDIAKSREANVSRDIMARDEDKQGAQELATAVASAVTAVNLGFMTEQEAVAKLIQKYPAFANAGQGSGMPPPLTTPTPGADPVSTLKGKGPPR